MKKFKFWHYTLFAIIIVIGLFLGFWGLNRYWFELPESAAEFGDSFGAINTLFSALAFAFLIVTALMQKNELKYQREELVETRRELKRTADAQEQSIGMLEKQLTENNHRFSIESTNGLYNELKMDFRNITIKDKNEILLGYSAVKRYLEIFDKYKNAENTTVIHSHSSTNRTWLLVLRSCLIIGGVVLKLDFKDSTSSIVAQQYLEFFDIYLQQSSEFVLNVFKEESDIIKERYYYLVYHYETISEIGKIHKEMIVKIKDLSNG